MNEPTAQTRAASAIVSNARVEAAAIIDDAIWKGERIVKAADRDAATVRANARAYAIRHNPDRPTIDSDLYRRVVHERYPTQGRRNRNGSH